MSGLIFRVFMALQTTTGGKVIGNKTNKIMALHNGLMSGASYVKPSVIQPFNVLNFKVMDNSLMPILHSVMLPQQIMWISFLILVQINTSHLILQIWQCPNHISIMIIFILVMAMAFSYLILDILSYIHQNKPSLYLTFSMYHIFKSHCFLFRNFALIIIFIFNFTHLCLILKMSTPKHCSFPARVKMVSMFFSSLLPHQFL